MFRRLLATVLTAAALGACSNPTPPAAPAAPAEPVAPTPAPDTAAPAAPASVAPAAAASVASATPAAPAAPVVDPNAPPPRLGTDYEVLSAPQPTWNPADGKIEVTEVFSYMCHVCAEVQPSVDLFKPTLPADVRWVYVPAAFGGPWDTAARAYFTAQVMGVADRAHSQVFPAIFVQQKIKQGTPEEFADLYAGFGADRATFLSTLSSFGVTAKFNRAKQFALRTGVTGTPTIIVNGKYKVMNTRDRGVQGMFATVNYLVAQERAASQPAAPAPVATP
jgi:thiol:disulfide interchange protein DsbA